MNRRGKAPIEARQHTGLTIPRLATLLGMLLCFGIAACGGRTPVPTYKRIDQRKQEIQQLWGQIREWRQEAGLRGVEPPRGEIIKMHSQSVRAAKRVCPDDIQPTTPHCKDVCSLAEAICDNTAQICRIAKELAGDSWAQGKCSSAKASCKQAKKRCCQCFAKETKSSLL